MAAKTREIMRFMIVLIGISYLTLHSTLFQVGITVRLQYGNLTFIMQ